MEVLHLPANIKVHFASCEVMGQYLAAKELGVNYGLFTCFPFVERMVFEKAKSPVIPLRWMNEPAIQIPQEISTSMRHVIQDSGLFTLMFGARAGQKNDSLVNVWYDKLVEFTLAHGQPVTCVEVDCQKILGVEKAWEFRERMKRDLPNNRIINVFHLEDGQKGLDRLIEFSEYIAISVPELRFANKSAMVPQLAHYIKKKKPNIDIHLLGCTALDTIKQCRFCTSCDSSTWTIGYRYGFIEGRHISAIKTEEVKQLVGADKWATINQYNNERNTNFLCLSVESLKRKYQKAAGNQDYYKK